MTVGGACPPLLLHLPSPVKLQCTLQLSGQIHWPCFISCKDIYSVVYSNSRRRLCSVLSYVSFDLSQVLSILGCPPSSLVSLLRSRRVLVPLFFYLFTFVGSCTPGLHSLFNCLKSGCIAFHVRWNINVPLAQRIARWTSNPKVLGSIPRWDGIFLRGMSGFEPRVLPEQAVAPPTKPPIRLYWTYSCIFSRVKFLHYGQVKRCYLIGCTLSTYIGIMIDLWVSEVR